MRCFVILPFASKIIVSAAESMFPQSFACHGDASLCFRCLFDFDAFINDSANICTQMMHLSSTSMVLLPILYLNVFVNHGQQYGLDINSTKFNYISIGCLPNLVQPDGTPVKHVHFITCPGSLLTEDGASSSVVEQRIEIDSRDFVDP